MVLDFCYRVWYDSCEILENKKEKGNFMEKKTALSEEKKQWLIVAAIMLVGILVRLLFVGRYPAGLNQDEHQRVMMPLQC